MCILFWVISPTCTFCSMSDVKGPSYEISYLVFFSSFIGLSKTPLLGIWSFRFDFRFEAGNCNFCILSAWSRFSPQRLSSFFIGFGALHNFWSRSQCLVTPRIVYSLELLFNNTWRVFCVFEFENLSELATKFEKGSYISRMRVLQWAKNWERNVSLPNLVFVCRYPIYTVDSL